MDLVHFHPLCCIFWFADSPNKVNLFLYHFFVISYLIGTLTSMQIKPREPAIISSIDELVKQNDIKRLVEAGGSFIIRGRESQEGTVLKYE